MPLRVSHRDDELLQNTCLELEKDPADHYIMTTVLPALQALVKFIDERLIGIDFRNQRQLENFLVEWPTFFREIHGHDPNFQWARLYLKDGGIRVANRSIYNELGVACVKRS